RKAFGDNSAAAGGLSDGLLATRGHGYRLRVEAGELDSDRFRELAEEGREALAAGDADRAAGLLRSGLALWRGPPLADLSYEAFAQRAITELEELRLGALEERVEADLVLGRHQQLVGELRALVDEHPLRERLRGQLMLALYRCGRQSEALDVYQDYRRGLAEELGLDPSPTLLGVEAAIRDRDPSLEAAVPVAPATAPQVSGRPMGHAPRARRRDWIAVGGLVLLAVALTAAVLVLTGGGPLSRSGIPADSVGVIS